MPSRPSPLSERAANAASRPFQFSMASSVPNDTKKCVAPRRAYKPNPVVQTRDAATKQRRDMFFKRVQQGREDKKWDARGEQIQRLDHISERKRWEAKKSREAPQITDDIVEQELEEAMPQRETVEADYILAQEEQEMELLIASMADDQDNATSHFGSDDDDYDQLFMEYTTSSAPLQQQHLHQDMSANIADSDAMDMS